MAQWEARDAAEREEARRKARERVLSDFERGMGLGIGATPSGSKQAGSATGSGASEKQAGEAVGSRLANAQLSAKDIEAAAQAAEDKALKKIAAEQAENKKTRLPSFWLPSLAPDAVNGKSQVKEKDIKLQTLCLCGSEPHPFSYVSARCPVASAARCECRSTADMQPKNAPPRPITLPTIIQNPPLPIVRQRTLQLQLVFPPYIQIISIHPFHRRQRGGRRPTSQKG